jgi:hypothetical protein
MSALAGAVVVMVVSYGVVMMAVLYAYRRGYGITARPELTLRFAARALADFEELTRP